MKQKRQTPGASHELESLLPYDVDRGSLLRMQWKMTWIRFQGLGLELQTVILYVVSEHGFLLGNMLAILLNYQRGLYVPREA